MHYLEYLTERDLKYFERKEAIGEAVIIRIEPEALLSLDLDALFGERKKDQTLSARELEAFFKGRKPGEKAGQNRQRDEEGMMTGLEKNLQQVHLSEEQKLLFMQAVDSGATDEELMKILQSDEDGQEQNMSSDYQREGGE